MTSVQFKADDRILEEEWFASYENSELDFIYDGATDPVKWLESPCKIMCLLKEAHGGGQWNHAAAILKDEGMLRVGGSANQALHYRMVEWLYAFESTLMGIPIDVETDRSEDYEACRLTMLRSAWVNIKKAEGTAYSDNGNLRAVAERDAKYLKKQISLLSPKFVLCGYTFGTVRDLLFPDAQKIAGTAFSHITTSGMILVDYCHPGRKARESYKPLVEEARRIISAVSLEPSTNNGGTFAITERCAPKSAIKSGVIECNVVE